MPDIHNIKGLSREGHSVAGISRKLSVDEMAAATIDRLVHHGHLLMFDAKSYRMSYVLISQNTISGTVSGKESS